MADRPPRDDSDRPRRTGRSGGGGSGRGGPGPGGQGGGRPGSGGRASGGQVPRAATALAGSGPPGGRRLRSRRQRSSRWWRVPRWSSRRRRVPRSSKWWRVPRWIGRRRVPRWTSRRRRVPERWPTGRWRAARQRRSPAGRRIWWNALPRAARRVRLPERGSRPHAASRRPRRPGRPRSLRPAPSSSRPVRRRSSAWTSSRTSSRACPDPVPVRIATVRRRAVPATGRASTAVRDRTDRDLGPGSRRPGRARRQHRGPRPRPRPSRSPPCPPPTCSPRARNWSQAGGPSKRPSPRGARPSDCSSCRSDGWRSRRSSSTPRACGSRSSRWRAARSRRSRASTATRARRSWSGRADTRPSTMCLRVPGSGANRRSCSSSIRSRTPRTWARCCEAPRRWACTGSCSRRTARHRSRPRR